MLWQLDGLFGDYPDCQLMKDPSYDRGQMAQQPLDLVGKIYWGKVSCPLRPVPQSFLWAESPVCFTKWPNTYYYY